MFSEGISYIKPFFVRFFLNNLDIFLGRKLDQIYIVLKVQKNEEISLMLKEIDKIMQSYNFPVIYNEDHIPHISLASCAITEDSDWRKEQISKEDLKNLVEDTTENIQIYISKICCKVGERLNYFKLRK